MWFKVVFQDCIEIVVKLIWGLVWVGLMVA